MRLLLRTEMGNLIKSFNSNREASQLCSCTKSASNNHLMQLTYQAHVMLQFVCNGSVMEFIISFSLAYLDTCGIFLGDVNDTTLT